MKRGIRNLFFFMVMGWIIVTPTHAVPSLVLPQIQGGLFRLDPVYSQVLFSASYLGLTDYKGFFSDSSGLLKLVIDPIEASQLTIDIPLQSLQTTNLNITKALNGKDWFDLSHYKTAVFTSTKIIRINRRQADIIGNLDLHGIVRPILLHVTFTEATINPYDGAYMIGFRIKGLLKRSDFGLTACWPVIGEVVKLNITGVFRRTNNGKMR